MALTAFSGSVSTCNIPPVRFLISPVKSLTRLGPPVTVGIGFMLAACVLGGYLVGSYLDSKFGTEPWLLIVFIIMCFAAGFREIYNILKKITKETTNNDKKDKEK